MKSERDENIYPDNSQNYFLEWCILNPLELFCTREHVSNS